MTDHDDGPDWTLIWLVIAASLNALSGVLLIAALILNFGGSR